MIVGMSFGLGTDDARTTKRRRLRLRQSPAQTAVLFSGLAQLLWICLPRFVLTCLVEE
jgi:hypothetical protein